MKGMYDLHTTEMKNNIEHPNTICLCRKCYQDYLEVFEIRIRRVDLNQIVKEPCTKCDRMGFNYIVSEKTKSPK